MEIVTDPTALEIIIKNVLDNAVKYSSGAPRVQIGMRTLNCGHLAIIVQDQGIGIERNQLKRIFKRFHRAPDPQVNERSGSGLGLYVVHRLVRNLGGRIERGLRRRRKGHDDAHPPAAGRRENCGRDELMAESTPASAADAPRAPCSWWKTRPISPRA